MCGPSKTRCIGILTSGGDCPGLNSAIRAITKAAIHDFGMRVIGIQDGFRGLVENRTIPLEDSQVSGILTRGGTILGTSRDKPNKMPMGPKLMDMTATAVSNARKMQLDCLVCLGGGGTQKNAYRLLKKGGLNVLTLPKTIDNDIFGTDISFGFDTAVNTATEAIDRLHTTATSHHRIIVCEIMGHRAGWLTLTAGVAGGADVILIPEIPYDLNVIAEFILERRRSGKRFSIIAVAEGSRSIEEGLALKAEAAEVKLVANEKKKEKKKGKKKNKLEERHLLLNGKELLEGKTDEALAEILIDETRVGQPYKVKRVANEIMTYHVVQEPMASRVARRIQELTGVEARVTSLGHMVRGGFPTAFDRVLCTKLGTKAAQLLAEGVYNVLVAYRNGECVPVPIEDVAEKLNLVPQEDPLIESARLVGTCFGNE